MLGKAFAVGRQLVETHVATTKDGIDEDKDAYKLEKDFIADSKLSENAKEKTIAFIEACRAAREKAKLLQESCNGDVALLVENSGKRTFDKLFQT